MAAQPPPSLLDALCGLVALLVCTNIVVVVVLCRTRRDVTQLQRAAQVAGDGGSSRGPPLAPTPAHLLNKQTVFRNPLRFAGEEKGRVPASPQLAPPVDGGLPVLPVLSSPAASPPVNSDASGGQSIMCPLVVPASPTRLAKPIVLASPLDRVRVMPAAVAGVAPFPLPQAVPLLAAASQSSATQMAGSLRVVTPRETPLHSPSPRERKLAPSSSYRQLPDTLSSGGSGKGALSRQSSFTQHSGGEGGEGEGETHGDPLPTSPPKSRQNSFVLHSAGTPGPDAPPSFPPFHSASCLRVCVFV